VYEGGQDPLGWPGGRLPLWRLETAGGRGGQEGGGSKFLFLSSTDCSWSLSLDLDFMSSNNREDSRICPFKDRALHSKKYWIVSLFHFSIFKICTMSVLSYLQLTLKAVPTTTCHPPCHPVQCYFSPIFRVDISC